MCLGVGASSGSKAINNEAGAAYGTAINQAKAEFGDANTVFNDIVQSTAPIVAAGPEQTGFSAQQESAINANTIDTTAAQYKNNGLQSNQILPAPLNGKLPATVWSYIKTISRHPE